MAEYLLFPGCVIQQRIPFIEASAKFVFDQLGLKYGPAEFGCCPNPVGIKLVDKKTWAALAARNIAVAEQVEKPIMSLCNGCFQSMVTADYELKHDAVLKQKVNEALSEVGKTYNGSVEIKHFVTVLFEEIGIEEIKKKIVKPLTGLKVACHPGCHYMRPSHILNTEDPEKPEYLHKLVEATGATVVDYPEELLCCGNGVRNSDDYTANTMLKNKIDSARNAGADCIVVNCPACFQQFDGEQGKLKTLAKEGEVYKFPVFYITELLALAMGKTPKEIGINFHRNKGKEALAKVGL